MRYTTKKGCCPLQGRELLPLRVCPPACTVACCCPPQGRELLPVVYLWATLPRSCCPPQGRELLRGNEQGISGIPRSCCPPQGRELLLALNSYINLVLLEVTLLSPAGARAVTSVVYRDECWRNVAVPRRGVSCYHNQQTDNRPITHRLLSPAGARVVTFSWGRVVVNALGLLSPAGARVVTQCRDPTPASRSCCPPQGHELLHHCPCGSDKGARVAVPRRGASCYAYEWNRFHPDEVAVPRRGASCYLLLL